jgi:hypothetical protein
MTITTEQPQIKKRLRRNGQRKQRGRILPDHFNETAAGIKPVESANRLSDSWCVTMKNCD